MNLSLKLIAVLLFGVALSFLLDSCGGGNLPIVKANGVNHIIAQHYIPDEDIEIPFHPSLTLSSDGGVTTVRVVESKKMLIENYSPDTLGMDWSIPLVREKGDAWFPFMHYKNGLLYCIGPNIFADGDSVGIRLLVIDPQAHSIQRDSRSGLSVSQIPASWDALPVLSPYSMDVSPDSNLVLFYRTDNRDVPDAEKTKMRKVHCEIYQNDGVLKKTFDITPPAPDPKISNAELALITHGIKIDNEGNLYHLTFMQPDKLQATKYPIANPAAPETLSASFKNCALKSDYKIGWPMVSFDPLTNVMECTAAREELQSGLLMKAEWKVMLAGDMRGVIHASFDFAKNQVHSFQYDPPAELLDTLIDQKNLNYYRIVKVLHNDARNMTNVFLEKRETGMTTTTHTEGGSLASNWTSYRTSTPYNYCFGLLLLAFDTDGKPLWQIPLPKDQTNQIDYFFKQKSPSACDIYYVDRETKPEGLQKRQLDLMTGSLSPAENILQFESDTYILTNYTLWHTPQTALLFAAGSTTFGGQLRLRNPLLFKLSTQ